MAEIITDPLPPRGILYSQKSLDDMAHPHSRLKPVEPGDRCCNCGGDCDGEGFAWINFVAKRVNGHPICTRPKCLDAQMQEFLGRRSGCRCGQKKT
jgi:hypothetical protein